MIERTSHHSTSTVMRPGCAVAFESATPISKNKTWYRASLICKICKYASFVWAPVSCSGHESQYSVTSDLCRGIINHSWVGGTEKLFLPSSLERWPPTQYLYISFSCQQHDTSFCTPRVTTRPFTSSLPIIAGLQLWLASIGRLVANCCTRDGCDGAQLSWMSA